VPRLSRELIGDAVLAAGFADLTLTGIGEQLAASHAALYRHIHDRDDLVVAGVERVVHLHPLPEADDWRVSLESAAWARWEIYTRYPGLAGAVSTNPAAQEVLARQGFALARSLVASGIEVGLAVLAADIVLDLVRDTARTAARLTDVPRDRLREAMERRLPEPGDDVILQVVLDAVSGDPAYWMGRKLDVVLRGLDDLVVSGVSRE